MERRTKIISTVGPKTNTESFISKLCVAGTNVIRINMSHASHAELEKIITIVKKINKSKICSVGIMIDTQGPEIRTAPVTKSIQLIKGEVVHLTPKALKGAKYIIVDNLKQVKGLKKGGKVSFDNGAIDLKIRNIDKDKNVKCEVLDSGEIGSRKHVNFPGAKVTLPSLTDKDKKDIKYAISKGVDFIALSFCRSKKDLNELKKFLGKKVSDVEIFVKIEDQEGLSNLEEVIENSDGVMVARGDLGIETDITNLPYIQRNIIKIASSKGKKSIVATQLLESMIDSPHPSRAEVSDVANAVYEGTDALMLSGETSIGKYPVECVKYIDQVARNAERSETLHFENNFKQQTDWHKLAATSVKLASKIDADAIVVLTRSGFTANLISRAKPTVPVFAFSNRLETQSKLSISSSTQNLFLKFTKDHEKTINLAFEVLKKHYKMKGRKKFVVISGLFSDIYADAIQIRSFG